MFEKEEAENKCHNSLQGQIPHSKLFILVTSRFIVNVFSAREQIEILRNEIIDEQVFWFGATWSSTQQEYLSDKGDFQPIHINSR